MTVAAAPKGRDGGRAAGQADVLIEAESADSLVQASIVSDSAASGGRKVRANVSGASLTLAGVPGSSVTFRYSSIRSTGAAFTIEFWAGSSGGPVLGAPGVLGTGSWTVHREVTYNLTNVPAGTTAVAVVVFRANDSAAVADLDWVRLAGSVVTPPAAGRHLLAGQSTVAA